MLLDLKVNGFPCKAIFAASDFFPGKLATSGSTNNLMGSNVTNANVYLIPGLNTLGVSMARMDYAPGGLNPPHIHPRASEIVFVIQGQLDVGFITPSNVLVSQTIKVGEIFVFPRGVVHFQKNNYTSPAAVIAAFNSQLQGTLGVVTALFTSKPPIMDIVLAQTFQISTENIASIRKNHTM